MQVDNEHAKQLLKRCKQWGVLVGDYTDDVLDLNLIESGIFDSMSMEMMGMMLEEYYGLEVTPQQFVVELRSLNEISAYIENN